MFRKITATVNIITMIFLILMLTQSVFSENLETPIRFGIIGDRTGGAVDGIYEGIVNEIELLKPDFVMTVGDMIEGPESDSVVLVSKWEEYFNIVQNFSMPVYYTPGNNDIDTDIMLTMYQHYLNNPYYSFDHKFIHITVLDNSRWEASKNYPKEQIDWLVKDLKKSQSAKHRLVFIHKPFWYKTVAMGLEDGLHEIFKQYNVDAVFCGHFHRYFSAEFDGIKYTTIGSSGGGYQEMPWSLGYHFAFVTITENEITITPIKAGAVQEWDVITTDEIIRSAMNTNRGLSFKSHLLISDNLKAPESELSVKIMNFNNNLAVNDTITWDVPEGWIISPMIQPITIEPGREQNFSFKISSSGNLYPVPSLSINLPYSDEIKQPVSKYLSIAREAVCNKTDKAPVIDGIIDEDLWKNPQSLFFNSDNTITEDDSTFFYIAYDEENLYLAAYCHESKMDELKAEITEFDKPVYSEDCVGFMFESKANSNTAYQIYVNPNGAIYDQKISAGYDGFYGSDNFWNGEYEVKAVKGTNFWSVEMKIPMTVINADNQSGSKWRLNFRRKHYRINSSAMWQLPWRYDPAAYGYMILK